MTRKHTSTVVARRFSRAWWLSTGHDFFWVAVVTLLGWIYADVLQTKDIPLKATLILTTGAKDLGLLSQANHDVAFTVYGNRGSLDRFERWLRDRGSTIRYDVSRDHRAGQYTLLSADLITRAAGLEEVGLTVRSSDPMSIPVRLDQVEPHTVRVRFDHTDATFANGTQPQITPSELDVRATTTAWDRIVAGATEGKPELLTERLDLKNAATGTSLTRRVSVVPSINGVPIELEVKYVTVTYQISQRTKNKTIKVPVQVLAPPMWFEDDTWIKHVLKRRDPIKWLAEITVSGSTKDIDQLKTENVRAYVRLTESDKKPIKTYLNRKVIIEFPPDLDVQIVDDPPPTVNLRLDPRPATPPPG